MLLEERIGNGVALQTLSPPLASGRVLDINKKQPELWRIFEREQVIIGDLAFDRNFKIVYPMGNCANEHGFGAHFIVGYKSSDCVDVSGVPRDGLFNMIANLKVAADSQGILWGYNQAADLTRKTSQTRHFFHTHCYKIDPRDFIKLEGDKRRELREPMYSRINKILMQWFSSANIGRGFDVNYCDDESGCQFPRGGLVFSKESSHLPDSELGKLLLDLDASYKDLHKKAFSSVLTNYDEWIRSRGEEAPVFSNHLSEKLASAEVDESLLPFSHTFRYWSEDACSPLRRVIAAPAYTISSFSQGGKTRIVFTPHFFGTRGVLESVGIVPVRQYSSNVSIERRYQKASALANNVFKGAIQDYSD